MKQIALTAFVMLAAIRASAASIDGAWTATVPTPNGQQAIEVVFTFKGDGSKLSGYATANDMTFDLVDTSVKGDAIAFAIEGDTAHYTGMLAGDEIRMTVTFTSNEYGTRKWDFVAKRKTAARSESIAGAWTGEVPRGGGQFIHADFDFEVDGSTLGGVVHALDLDLPVRRGTIDGSLIAFNVGDSKGDYSGEIAGDVIRMRVKYSGGETGRVTLDFVLTRRKR